MLNWLRRLWPFAMAKTCRLLRESLAHMTANASSAAAQARRAERDMTCMQLQLSHIMREAHGDWLTAGNRAMRLISDDLRRSNYIAAMDTPTLSLDQHLSYKHIGLIRFSISIGLSENCPPEIVAEQIANRVRDAVLAHWRSQSVLLRLPNA